ncbi:MAG TPA: PEP-CTERM sorting domain-containing protein [Pirellulales bacterium]
MRTISRMTGIAAALSLACFATIAVAGPLPLNPDAIPGFSGTSTVASGLIAGKTLNASIDYAVFAPGQFNAYFGPGADPSNGTQYVYAYELTNTGATANVSRSANLLTVDLLPASLAQNIGYLPVANGNYGTLPSGSSFADSPPSSSRWSFSAPVIGLGGVSQIVLFTSPEPPTRGTAAVVGGGLQATTTVPNYVPTPIPEPSTFVLMAIAGSALALIRRRSKN